MRSRSVDRRNAVSVMRAILALALRLPQCELSSAVGSVSDSCERRVQWLKVRVEPGSWVRSPEWTAIYLALERLNCASDLGRPCHSIVWHAKDPSGRPEAKLSVELGGLERLGWWVRVLCDKYESTLLSPRANSHLYKPFGLNS